MDVIVKVLTIALAVCAMACVVKLTSFTGKR